ncbi:MAG TPA: site-specific DNA-methyltransferase [Ignavibacteriaceae bacterium]|nr:site-specific DNA-methyltransferase [Ignavibacteriaceae bacterium]
MINFPLPRIDEDEILKELLLPYCRFKENDIYVDKINGHKIGCIDCNDKDKLSELFGNEKAKLAVHDPPYNFVAFDELEVKDFIEWSRKWVNNTLDFLDENSSLYIWLGADQANHFQPLPEFMLMMKEFGVKSRSFITMRNQRGYGTQKNWMAIKQELLYYKKGEPVFNVSAEYTEIPKVLKGYYKIINGVQTENLERSKSENIRAGNVWIDIQQVFYRMEENVNGCYAQKPLKSIERIVRASSNEGDVITDLFSHSGTTLIAAERLNRKCFIIDIDPIYCEITLRRLENLRTSGRTGWQNGNPFAEEIKNDKKIIRYLKSKYDISYKSKKIKTLV